MAAQCSIAAPGPKASLRNGRDHSRAPGPARFLVHEAAGADRPHVCAWLPDAMRGMPAATIFMALDATGAPAGCAALRVFPADRVGRFWVFVDSGFRRRGCGTELLMSVRQAARAVDAVRLLTGPSYPAEPRDADTDATLAFFRARGLSVGQDLLGYRAELQPALEVLRPLYERAVRGGTYGRRARIVTADQVDRFALADFVARHLGGIPGEVAGRFGGHGQAFNLAVSMAALVDDGVAGALLIQKQGNTAFIESRVVERQHRGSWINLAMMYRASEALSKLGVSNIEFEGEAQDRDTSKLARRLGAVQVARRQCWSCALQVPPPGPEAIPCRGGLPGVSELPHDRPAAVRHEPALRDPRVDGLTFPQLQERLFFDSANDLIQLLSERSVETLSLANQVRGITLHVRLERHGPEVFDRQTGLKNAVLFLALPRSASLYAFNTLAAGLGLDKVTVDSHRFPHEAINPHLAARLTVPGAIAHSHADARAGNLTLLNPILDRLVVHVRDPRQALLSAVHHLNDLHAHRGPGHVAGFDLPLPGDYFELPLDEQIDWMIANGLPELVRWVEGWLDAAANPLFRPRVLFTRYEDLHADATGFFARLRGFYEVGWSTPEFRPPPPQTGSQHYRKGQTDEWRTVLTPAQQEAACAQLSARVRERFAWPAR